MRKHGGTSVGLNGEMRVLPYSSGGWSQCQSPKVQERKSMRKENDSLATVHGEEHLHKEGIEYKDPNAFYKTILYKNMIWVSEKTIINSTNKSKHFKI